MTLLDAVAATSSGYTNTEIAGIITATLMGIAAVGGVVVKLVVARRPIDKMRAQQEHKREDTMAQLLHEANEERRKIEQDRDRKAHENANLLAENVEYRRDIIEMREEIDECRSEINSLKDEVRECHEGRAKEAEMRAEESEAHAANMQSLVLWMTDEMVRAGMRPSSPPKLRSITPRDFPAVTSTDGAKKNV